MPGISLNPLIAVETLVVINISDLGRRMNVDSGEARETGFSG